MYVRMGAPSVRKKPRCAIRHGWYPVSTDDGVARAAARILARHEDANWRPTDDELDAWGRGYFAGHRQGYADAFTPRPQVDPQAEDDWPEVARPGGGS